MNITDTAATLEFPFLFGGTFIEAQLRDFSYLGFSLNFPSFSEGLSLRRLLIPQTLIVAVNFPSFSEGLSLRPGIWCVQIWVMQISLPFRRDFH